MHEEFAASQRQPTCRRVAARTIVSPVALVSMAICTAAAGNLASPSKLGHRGSARRGLLPTLAGEHDHVGQLGVGGPELGTQARSGCRER